ncbi:DUF6177 family protein [Streptomyces sp. NBC_00079]
MSDPRPTRPPAGRQKKLQRGQWLAVTLAGAQGWGAAPELDRSPGLRARRRARPRHRLVALRRAARRDLTVPPKAEARPVPVAAFTLGGEEADRAGTAVVTRTERLPCELAYPARAFRSPPPRISPPVCAG